MGVLIDLFINVLGSKVYSDLDKFFRNRNAELEKANFLKSISDFELEFCKNNDYTIIANEIFSNRLRLKNTIENLYKYYFRISDEVLTESDFIKNQTKSLIISIESGMKQSLSIPNRIIVEEFISKVSYQIRVYLFDKSIDVNAPIQFSIWQVMLESRKYNESFLKLLSEQGSTNKKTDSLLSNGESTIDLPESISFFLVLMSIQCAKNPYYFNKNLWDTLNNILSVFQLEKDVNVAKMFESSQEKGYIAGYPHDFLYLTNNGKKYLKTYMEKNWSKFEDLVAGSIDEGNATQILFNKYIMENMPYKVRLKRLVKIINFLTHYYKKICYHTETCNRKVILPFHLLLGKAHRLQEIQCEIDYDVRSDEVEYDEKYLAFYIARDIATRNHENVPRQVYNGSVYRLLDYNVNKNGSATLFIGTDKGYIDFQSTCGKIRNEIEYAISQYKNHTESFANLLTYRQKTVHDSNEAQIVSHFLKKRVVKIGIETCVIFVDKNEPNIVSNPRVPIMFRNTNVAEYPEFSMVVPSGAYQASVLMEHKGDSYFEELLIERSSWEVSVIRELGEELFQIELLEHYHIKDLMESKQYLMCKEIVEECSVCFKPTGFGIDLYIGSGNMLVTLILDYNAVLDVLKRYATEDASGLFIETQKKFEKLTTGRAKNGTEGRTYLFNLNDEFMEHVISYYITKDKHKVSPLIQPLNTEDSVEFKPMIPSGVLSVINAKQEYDLLTAHG